MARRVEKHHALPTSRGGNQNDIVEWDVDFHRCFHQCFRNMTVEECVAFIMETSVPGGHWDAKRLHKRREEIIAASGGKYVPSKKGGKK